VADLQAPFIGFAHGRPMASNVRPALPRGHAAFAMGAAGNPQCASRSGECGVIMNGRPGCRDRNERAVVSRIIHHAGLRPEHVRALGIKALLPGSPAGRNATSGMAVLLTWATQLS